MKMKWLILFSAPIFAMACADATVPTDDYAGDPIDGTFLVDGKADAFGVVEGSPEANAILALVNEASFQYLDVDVSLDRRAAQNIVAYRLGPDGRAGTADDETYDDLEELDRIPWVGARAFGKLVDFVGVVDPDLDSDVEVHGFTEGSREAEAILAAANLLDLETLDDDVGLDVRAATNIIDYRSGVDGNLGTSDDRVFHSLTELDRISYVASSAFNDLLDYALANDLIAPDDGSRPGESSDPFSSSYCLGDPITTPQAVGHFSEGKNSATLGEGKWHRRKRTCNELTGCAAWTDVRNDYITASLGLNTRSDKVYATLSDTPASSERSINCNYNSVDESSIRCRAVDRSYNSHNYNGRITDHCARLTRTVKTSPNSSSSWTETEYVYTHRFASSQPRTFGEPTTPSIDAASGSPFAQATCNGPAISQTEALERFAAGMNSASFGSGEWHRRNRTCNELTGCTDWDETQGYLSATTSLNIRSAKVYMALSDTPASSERSINCNYNSVDESSVRCRAVDRSYNSHNYSGRVTDECVRLERVVTASPNSSNSYGQTQYVYFQNH